MSDRNRMIIDVPEEVQMAIKLQAARLKKTTGDVVSLLVGGHLGRRLEEAQEAIAEQKKAAVLKT